MCGVQQECSSCPHSLYCDMKSCLTKVIAGTNRIQYKSNKCWGSPLKCINADSSYESLCELNCEETIALKCVLSAVPQGRDASVGLYRKERSKRNFKKKCKRCSSGLHYQLCAKSVTGRRGVRSVAVSKSNLCYE